MEKFVLGVATVLAVSSAFPVVAGGLAEVVTEPSPVSAPVVPQVSQPDGWGGFYIGGQIGTLKAESSVRVGDFLPGNDFPNEFADFELEGGTYGLHAGYMYDMGRFVLGGEIDYDVVNFDDATVEFDGVTETITADDDGTIARVKLRAGYNAGRVLPYATVGLARFEVDSDDTNGTFFGGGVAFKATDNILLGGEVLRHQFDDSFDTGIDVEVTTLSLRASYKF